MVCGQAVTDLAPATLRRMVAGRLRASGGWGVAEGPPSGDPQLPSPAVLEQRQARHLAASADACRSPRQCAHAPHTTCLVSEHTCQQYKHQHTRVNSTNINSRVSTVQNQHTQVNSTNTNTRVNSTNINSRVSTVQNQHTQVNSTNINTRVSTVQTSTHASTVQTSTHASQQYKTNTRKSIV